MRMLNAGLRGLRGLWQDVKEAVPFVLKVGGVVFGAQEYFGYPVQATGPSMLPTVKEEGDWVFCNIRSIKQKDFGVGDMVVAIPPYDGDKYILKRIIGMPGDMIQAPSTSLWDEHRWETVPRGHVWLQGDNVSCSTDSRHYGPVSINLIKGKVTRHISLWPPSFLRAERTLKFSNQPHHHPGGPQPPDPLFAAIAELEKQVSMSRPDTE